VRLGAEAVRLAAGGAAGGKPALVLDVRTRGEFAKGWLSASLNVPLDELRDSLDTLDPERDTIVVSKAGFEGHLAVRQLRQHGFAKARYVSGGMASLALVPGVSREKDE
jgi:rhodanese-related sulfurtransferase